MYLLRTLLDKKDVYCKRDRLKTAYFITTFIGLLYKCTYFLMRGYGTYRSFATTV